MKQQEKRKQLIKRTAKGQYGYMDSERKFVLLRTSLYFLISILIFAMGWISTGEKTNLLTIVAVLGMLPASKSAVEMIMYLKNKGCSKEVYAQIAPRQGELTMLYDLVLTTYDKTFTIASLVIKGHSICGYTETAKTEEAAAQKHIEETLKIEGYKNYTVKIFHDLDKYLTRLDQLRQLEEEETKEKMQVTEALLAVSL